MNFWVFETYLHKELVDLPANELLLDMIMIIILKIAL